MSRSRTLLFLCCSLLLALGLLWGRPGLSAGSTPPTVGTPVVQPAVLHVNQLTHLTVVSRIRLQP